MKDLDVLREELYSLPASSQKLRTARLYLFDLYRYAEEYDKLCQLITDAGGIIE